jgi:hypothetical protein
MTSQALPPIIVRLIRDIEEQANKETQKVIIDEVDLKEATLPKLTSKQLKKLTKEELEILMENS